MRLRGALSGHVCLQLEMLKWGLESRLMGEGHIALAEDPSLVPSIDIWQLTTACGSSSRGSYALIWI